MIVKANEVRSYQKVEKARKQIECMLNREIIDAAKNGCNKLEIKLYKFDYLEKDIIKQLLRAGGYKFYMTTWDDSVIIRW